ncbi:MAG: MBL fold metallo-hydrolase [Bacillota bacterium]
MKLRKINESTFYFSSAVNIGYIMKDNQGLLIDTGIDDSTIKKVLKTLKNENLPLNYCIVTHAHTDHFGGASYLKEQTGIKLYAPKLEKAIIENPLLEPVYLWNGAYPLKELRSKFLEGKAVEVDETIAQGEVEIGPFTLNILHLPGHSAEQAGVLFNEILFAADAYFGTEALNKHVVPFITDAEQTIETLHRLKKLRVNGFVPGHGDFEHDISRSIAANIDVHITLMSSIENLLDKNGRVSFDQLLKKFLEESHIESRSIGQLLLYRTSFTAYITKLIHDGSIKAEVKDNLIYLQR